jgi:hypothetical protein
MRKLCFVRETPMLRRSLVVLAAVTLAACNASPPATGDNGAGVSGYTLVVRADENAQVYLVAHADGAITGARVTGGASELLDQRDARTLLGEPLAFADGAEPPEQVAVNLPGFQLSVRADEDGASSDNAHVNINVGGKRVEVNAQDNDGDAGAHEQARVRVTGADAQEARDFIAKAEGVSDAVQAEMLEVLGLD